LMQAKVIDIDQTGAVGTPQDVIGLNHCEVYTKAFLAMLEADKGSVNMVRMFAGELGGIANKVKGYMQRQQQAAQKQAQQGNGKGGLDPKDAAKIQATQAQAQSKIQMGQQSHAAKTAQRQIAFEEGLKQDREKHAAELQKLDLEAVGNIRRNRLTSMKE